MKLFSSLICALLILGHASPAFTSPSVSEDPGRFIARLGDRVMAILESPSNRTGEREGAIRRLFDDALDYRYMARRVLGRFWMRISESERTEFQVLFREHVVAVYSAQFARYAGEQFEVLKHTTWSDKTITVWTLLKKKNGEETPMNFRLRQVNGALRIIDLVVQGVSHVLIKRSEFSSIIINHGLDVLFQRLRAGQRVQLQTSRVAHVSGSTVLARLLRVAHLPCAGCGSIQGR